MPRFVITLTAEQLHFARTMAAAANRSVSNQLASLLIEAMHKNSSVQQSAPQHLTAKPMQENPIVPRSAAEPQQNVAYPHPNETFEEFVARTNPAAAAVPAKPTPAGAEPNDVDVPEFFRRLTLPPTGV